MNSVNWTLQAGHKVVIVCGCWIMWLTLDKVTKKQITYFCNSYPFIKFYLLIYGTMTQLPWNIQQSSIKYQILKYY